MSMVDDIKKLDLRPFERHRTIRLRSVVRQPTQHPTKTCAAILTKLRAEGIELPGPDHHYRIHRVHAGHHQRSAGAWSWSLDWRSDNDDNTGRPANTYNEIGSRWSAAECIKHDCELHQNRFGTEMIPKQAKRL